MLLMLSLSLPAGRSQPFSFFLQLIFPIGEEKCIAWALHNFSGVLRIRKRHSKVNLYFIIRKKKKGKRWIRKCSSPYYSSRSSNPINREENIALTFWGFPFLSHLDIAIDRATRTPMAGVPRPPPLSTVPGNAWDVTKKRGGGAPPVDGGRVVTV